jgi:membrane protease YdiL (CAAX protease family)
MAVVGTAIMPGLIEEIMIRGIVMQPLRRYGDWFAIICSSLIFSILHQNMVQIPYTFVSGIYFGYIAIATGSLWPTIVLHFLNNFTSVLVVAYESNLSEIGFVIATLITYAAIIIVGIVGGIWYFKLRYKVRLARGVKTLKNGEKAFNMFVNVPMLIAIVLLIIETLGSVKLN